MTIKPQNVRGVTEEDCAYVLRNTGELAYPLNQTRRWAEMKDGPTGLFQRAHNSRTCRISGQKSDAGRAMEWRLHDYRWRGMSHLVQQLSDLFISVRRAGQSRYETHPCLRETQNFSSATVEPSLLRITHW